LDADDDIKVYLEDGIEIDNNDVLLSDIAKDKLLVLAYNDKFVETGTDIIKKMYKLDG
jgi:hypothetical protein